MVSIYLGLCCFFFFFFFFVKNVYFQFISIPVLYIQIAILHPIVTSIEIKFRPVI